MGRPRRVGAASAIACLAIAAGACAVEPSRPVEHRPRVRDTQVLANPHNVLSAIVVATVEAADSVRVRFGVEGRALDSLTPISAAGAASDGLPVLGLLPSTAYRFQLVAFAEGRQTVGDTVRLVTGALPADLPSYSAGGPDPGDGFVVFAAHPYGIAIDRTGRVVWYRRLEAGPTLNFQVQSTGRYTTSPVTPAPGDATPWTEFDALGRVTRRLGCAQGLAARFHELRTLADGSYWILCDDVRVMDLRAIGGAAAAVVTGTALQRIDATGALRFSWSAFDHLDIADLDPAGRTGATVNWTHGNAFDFDSAGGVLLSFRSLNEITRVDLATGAVTWRLGGRANQFTFADSTQRFAGQHGLRVISAGVLQFLDNRGRAGDSRAMRLGLDTEARRTTGAATFVDAPPVNAILGGSTQALRDGRVLVAYGNGDRVQEYDAAGRVVWEIHGDPGYVFRAQWIGSLYTPGVPRR